MKECCDFCREIVDQIQQDLEFSNDTDQQAVLIAMIEAIGKKMECGESKLVCYPLLKLASGLSDE